MKRKDRSSTSTKEERKTKKTKKISDLEEIQQISKLDFTSAEKLFSSLIAPTTSDAFFTDYWKKKPLLINREDSSFYGPLFTKEDLQDILKREELSFVKDVHVFSYVKGDKLYTIGDREGATLSRVSQDIKEKNATVQLNQPQRFKDILWKLNAHLEKLFGCLVGANVYITPPDSQGPAPHHDDVEIFILQIEGEMQWKLYKPPTELAQECSPDLDQDAIGQPKHEFELQPGDMVYFPRGTILHQAVIPKNDSHSTHITLSTYQQQLASQEQQEEAMKDDNGDAEKAPTEDSEVKFRYPEHVRVSVGSDSEDSKGEDEENSEDEAMDGSQEEEEKPKAKKTSKSKQKPTKKSEKSKTKKKQKEESDEESDSFELGEDDTEGDSSDDEDESDEEGEGPWVFVHHSLNNDPTNHMMPQQPSIIKFSLTFKDAVLHLYRERHDYVPVKSLPLESEDALHLMTSLWSEGLIDIKE